MRVIFLGASETNVFAARALVEDKHDVVVIETSESRIREVSPNLDCSFLCGDGATPELLREAGVDTAGIVYCTTDDDKSNILTALVARHLGAERVVVSTSDHDLSSVCHSLGLEDVIVPAQSIGKHLHDMVMGLDTVELSTVLRDNTRLFRVEVGADEAGPVADLDLPDDTTPLWLYRGEKHHVVTADTRLARGDELILLTLCQHLGELKNRFDRD